MHIRQSEIAFLVAIRQLLVIDPDQVETRGMEIVDVDRVSGDSESEIVGASVGESALHAAAGYRERSCFVTAPPPPTAGSSADNRSNHEHHSG